jgi:hypothetical protein
MEERPPFVQVASVFNTPRPAADVSYVRPVQELGRTDPVNAGMDFGGLDDTLADLSTTVETPAETSTSIFTPAPEDFIADLVSDPYNNLVTTLANDVPVDPLSLDDFIDL